ncbi:MAG: peptidylprolyl isomerase [Chlorobi bacterium]|nr:peptidylprolyl isomerase [Chlorobiota bacterium]
MTLLLSIALLIFACKNKIKNPQVRLVTNYGNIEIELYKDKAPLTCSNFLNYVDNDLLKNAKFYRVVRNDNQPHNKIKIEVVQWGLMLDDNEYVLPPIIHESTKKTGILHKNGIVSMARNQPGTASSEFFICIGDQPELDYGGQRNPDRKGFAAFGKVINGMGVVKQIQLMADTNQFLVNPVAIISVERIK